MKAPLTARGLSRAALVSTLFVVVYAGVGCDDKETHSKAVVLKISPNVASMRVNQTVIFAAIPYDRRDHAVRGSAIKWQAYNVTMKKKAPISADGSFTAHATGEYNVTATMSHIHAELTLRVAQGVTTNLLEKPSATTIVSRIGTPPLVVPKLAPQPVILAAWDEKQLRQVFAVRNGLGHVAGFKRRYLRNRFSRSRALGRVSQALNTEAGIGNQNYSLDVPLLNLTGRGQDLALGVFYNSKTSDLGLNWPAVGWSSGFGRAISAGTGGVVLQDGDGTAHNYGGRFDWYTWGYIFGGYTTDGTMIDYSFTFDANGLMVHGESAYPNGTVVLFGAKNPETDTSGGNVMYPIKITDRNGNYVAITYIANHGPRIESIVDTLGRVIQYYYDGNGLLTSVVAPGISGAARTVVRFHYQQGNYTGDCFCSQLDAIYFPGTSTGYWFGDSDSYLGSMIVKVSKRRNMSLSASGLSEQGAVTAGIMTTEQVYNYSAPADPTQPPTYTTMTEAWAQMDTPPAVTTYSAQLDANPRRGDTTYADGTRVTLLMYNDPNAYDDGLTFQKTTLDASGNQVLKVVTDWEKGDNESPRVKAVHVTDKRGQTATTLYVYYVPPPNYFSANQLIEVDNINYDGNTVLRKTQYEYENNSNYLTRHIYNLRKSETVIAADGGRASRTEYIYDGQTLQDTPGVIGHSDVYNPYAPTHTVAGACQQQCSFNTSTFNWDCQTVCAPDTTTSEYDPSTDFRGNVTRTTRYTNATTLTGPVIEDRRYTITGTLFTISGSCCVATYYEYGTDTEYAFPSTIIRGNPDPSSNALVRQSFTYDFDTSLQLSRTDPNGRTTYTEYDPNSLRPSKVTLSTSAFTTFDYDDGQMTATESSYLPWSPLSPIPGKKRGPQLASQRITHLNGLGFTWRAETIADDNSWNAVSSQYDAMGRVWRRSQPYQLQAFGNTPNVWTEYTYDALGRIVLVTTPDSNQTTAVFDDLPRPSGASSDPGSTLQVIRPAASRWFRKNALGQLVEVVEPAAYGGATGVRTAYSYNSLGQVVGITRGSASQQYQFQYDSLGRLTAGYSPEKRRSLDRNGNYLMEGTGLWSDAWTYDDRSNLTSHTDARGVKTIYNYNDPLNRLLGKSYANENPSDQSIVANFPIEYRYVQAGDVTRLFQVAMTQSGNDSWGLHEYSYDSEGRLASKKLTYPGVGSLTSGYGYDALNRVVQETYPAEDGTPARARKVVNVHYGVGGMLKNSDIDGSQLVSQVVYNPGGQATQMVIGPSGPQQTTESYGYDPLTALLKSQSVQRGGTSLLNLTYGYYPGGQLMQEVNTTGTISYGYDAVGRLHYLKGTNSSDGTAWSEAYDFDEYGNLKSVGASGELKSVTASGGVSDFQVPVDGLSSATYDAATNHITVPNYSYDYAGNVTLEQRADGSWQEYRYDQENHLSEVIDHATGTPLESYIYGADGRRLLRAADFRRMGIGSLPTSRTYYFWDGDHVIGEYVQGLKGPWTWSKSQIFGGNRIIAAVLPSAAGETVQYYHPDRLGTRIVTNSLDASSTEQRTLPFGTPMPGYSSFDPIFTSYERSPTTGLDYAVNRYYRPGVRFTQSDPGGIQTVDLTNPQTVHPYVYVANDPINRIDSRGMVPDGPMFDMFTIQDLQSLGQAGVWGGGGAIAGAAGGPMGAGFGALGGAIAGFWSVQVTGAIDMANGAPPPQVLVSGLNSQTSETFTNTEPVYGSAWIPGTADRWGSWVDWVTVGTTVTVNTGSVYTGGVTSYSVTTTATNFSDGRSVITITYPDGSTLTRYTSDNGNQVEVVTPPTTQAPGPTAADAQTSVLFDPTGLVGSALTGSSSNGTTGTDVTSDWGLDLTGCCDDPNP